MTQRRDDQKELLNAITRLGAGQAEASEEFYSARWFLPLPEHLRALDPDVVLVVGDRGAGKSHLFRSVFSDGLLDDIASTLPNVRLPDGGTGACTWLKAYPVGSDFPGSRELSAHLKEAGMSSEAALDLWYAYFVRLLSPHFDPKHRSPLQTMLKPPGADYHAVLSAFKSLGNLPLLALDALDARLQEQGKWIFVGYDELDTVAGFDWPAMSLSVQGLVAFWASYARRWKRLRAKIFLRSDLFRRHANLGGGDLSKLAGNRAEVTWNDRTIWSMLIKRVANTQPELLDFCRKARVRFTGETAGKLGWIPILGAVEDARPFVERLASPYMGANVKKGHTFTWMLDHLRDGRARISPRSLVQLVEQAATKERDSPRETPPRLLHPVALRQALEDVSSNHVIQAQAEWPWLYGFKKRIEPERLVPWSRTELILRLKKSWKGDWSENQMVRPPVEDEDGFINYLIELGVLRERKSDGRIDVPDLYLFGLGLRRKGGVAAK